jgi:glycosyltransferase involved in cell wall biosynthesis
MANQPAVSVIMAVYNGEQFVTDSLKTTLAQTYPNFNVIVVDDGSTDNTNKIVSEIASTHPNLKLITLPHNRGQFYARAHAV